MTDNWKTIVASSFDWDQAHIGFQDAVADLDPSLRNKKPEGLPYSVWDIVEHIRIAQHDLLEFGRNADYHHDMKWPDDYWPKDKGPVSHDASRAYGRNRHHPTPAQRLAASLTKLEGVARRSIALQIACNPTCTDSL